MIQDRWAELSEKLSDRFGLMVKYGGGPEHVQQILARASESCAVLDEDIGVLLREPGELHGALLALFNAWLTEACMTSDADRDTPDAP